MTVLQTETFEAGTIGNAVQEVETIFSNVDNVGITYVTGLVGSKACNVAPATTGACRNSGFTAMGKVVFRWQFRFSALPSGDCVIGEACLGDPNLGGVRIAQVRLTAAGTLQIRDQFTAKATTTSVLAINTTYALEWMFDGATKTQTLRFFTDTSSVAVPSETITGSASLSAAVTCDWVQVGKMTNVAWTGGLTFDQYQRADDWIANPPLSTWNEHFNGTVGSDVATNANIFSITSTPPVVAVGGIHVDQKVALFAAQTSSNREIESTRFPSGTVTAYSRVYCSVGSVPADPLESQVIWQAKGTGGVASFALVAHPSAPNGMFNLGLWAAQDWKLYDPENPTPGPLPQAVSGDIPINTYFRLDITVTDNQAGALTCRVDVYVGAAKHLTGAANRLSRLDATGTLGGIRAHWLCQTVNSPTAVNRVAVSFDEWVGSTAGAPGPLDTVDQWEIPVGQQWAFSEWYDTGGGVMAERPLLLEGAFLGTQSSGVDTFRVRSGQFEKNGQPWVPVGFSMMAVNLPIGSEGLGGGGSEEAWATWSTGDRQAFFTAMRDQWHVDTFRLQMGQAGIDPSGPNYSQAYVDRIVGVVSELRDEGFITILCMNDGASANGTGTQLPTAATQRAWQKLLPYFNAWSRAKRTGVAAEIFNEPKINPLRHDNLTAPIAADWDQWLNGGHPSGALTQAENGGVVAVGHQQVLNTIRGTTFDGVVIAMGQDNGHTLNGMPKLTDTLAVPNVGYSIHTQRYHLSGNTATQDRTQIWEPQWLTPRDTLNIAVTATEWSLRQLVDDGIISNLKAVTPTYLDWMQANRFGIQPWAIDPNVGNYSYVLSKTGVNAWVPNDWDAYDPAVNAAGTGAGELLFNRYPTWTEGQVEAINIGATQTVVNVPQQSTLRVSGDPGEGKVLLGWNAGDSMAYIRSGRAWLRGLDPGAPYAPNPNIAPGVFKVFSYQIDFLRTDPLMMVNPFGTHSQTTWTTLRNFAANGDIIQWCIDMEDSANDSLVSRWVQNLVDGFYDPWVEQILAPGIKDCYERYGTAFHINWSNEPDTINKSNLTSNLTNLRLLRQASRRLHFQLLALGVPRDSFEVGVACLTNQASHFHHQKWLRPHQVDGPQAWTNNSANKHHLAHFLADWKGQDPTTIGWTDAWKPPKVAIIQPGEMDQWNYGAGPIVRHWAVDSYCEDAWGSNNQGASLKTIPLATLKSTHQFSHFIQDSWSSHGGGHQKFLVGAYGKQIPIVIGEWGYGIHDLEAAPDLPGTMELGQSYMEDFVANSVIGICKWRQDWPTNGGPHAAGSAYGPISFTRRGPSGTSWTSGNPTNRDDPTDAYGKMLASMWSSPRAQNPKSKGTSVSSKPFDHA